MPDDADPPRKFYGFKAREFERANEIRPSPAPDGPPAPDPGIVPISEGKIDVNELIRLGAGKGSSLGANAVVNRPNEIHDVLKDIHERDWAAGHFALGRLDDSKRRKRIRNYWLGLAAVDIPLGLFAALIGPGAAIPFVSAIAGIGMFTGLLTWQVFFLRTRY